MSACAAMKSTKMLTRSSMIYLGLAAVVLLASVLATLWLTAPKPPEAPHLAVDRLLSRKIASYSDLNDAAAAAGLHNADSMQGSVDSVNRTNDREVAIVGWLSDVEGDATPLDILVFIGGTLAAKGQTNGERPDVTRSQGLAFGAEKNIIFQVTFACRVGDQPVVAGLGLAKRYFAVPVSKCP
jgi:hypothetical protein